MKQEDEETERYFVWVDWENRIISFEAVEGFEKREYPTYAEMLDFAVNKGFSGFAIQ